MDQRPFALFVGSVSNIPMPTRSTLRSSETRTVGRTTMVYDALNRQTEVIDPLGHSLTMAYDGASRLSGKTDRLGQRQEFTYDNDNRVLTEVWKDSGGSTVNTITHVYDALGNTTTLADQNGTLTWVYDGLSRVSSEQGLFGQVLTYTLDAVGNTTRVDDSQGGVTTSVYNAINLLTERDFCGVGQTPLRMDLTYTVRNQVSQLDRYSDLAGTTKIGETDTTYDDAGRTIQITHKDGSGTTLIQTTYTYDLASRLETETIDGSTHTLTYDAVNQLTDDGSNSYSFDLAGNRTMSGYQTGASNQLTNDGIYTYTYDAEGNRVSRSKSLSDESWTFGYSVANQMTWMEERATAGGTLLLRVEEKYDALGRRIEEARWTSATGTVTTRFAYQGDNVRADLDGSNALTVRYVRPDGVDALGARINAAGVASWYLTDRQGTVQGNTDASGALSNKNTYDGFGARTAQTNASASDRYLYTGRELQVDSGLQYNRARWYDTRTGSWTTIDPKGFDAGDDNLYRYVKNGPTNATDPTGEYLLVDSPKAAENVILRWIKSPGWNDSYRISVEQLRSTRVIVRVTGRNGDPGFPLGFDANDAALFWYASHDTQAPYVLGDDGRGKVLPLGPDYNTDCEMEILGRRVTAARLAAQFQQQQLGKLRAAQEMADWPDDPANRVTQRKNFCAICHGTLDGEWKNIAAFPWLMREAPAAQTSALAATNPSLDVVGGIATFASKWSEAIGLGNPMKAMEAAKREDWTAVLAYGVPLFGLAKTYEYIQDIKLYKQKGLSIPDAVGLATAQHVPLASSLVKIDELYNGRSLQAGDYGRELDGVDKFLRGLEIAVDLGTLAIGGYKGLKGGTKTPGGRAGALFVQHDNCIPTVRFRPGPMNVQSAELKRVHEILEAAEDIVQRDLKALESTAQTNRQAGRLLRHVNNTQCGNIAASVDEFLATGTKQPVPLRRGTPTISTAEQMMARRGGELTTIEGPKRLAQEAIVDEMLHRGPGSKAIVKFDRAGMDGHFLNVVNIDGKVWFIDAHAGFAVPGNRAGALLVA